MMLRAFFAVAMMLPLFAGAQVKIPSLPPSPGVTGNDLAIDDQNGVTYAATYAQILAYVNAGLAGITAPQLTGTTGTGAIVLGTGPALTSPQINGAAIPASASVLGTNGAGQLVSGATTGTGNHVLSNNPVITLGNATNLPLSGIQAQPPGTVVSNPGATTTAPIAAYPQINLNPKNYGAVGTGTSTTAGSKLGISTLAGLVGYTKADGSTPYSWAGTYPHGTLFNLPVSVISSAAATTLTFSVSQTVGLALKTTAATTSGATFTFGSVYGLYPGITVTGSACIPANTYVTATFTTTLTLSASVTCTVALGTVLTFATPSVPTPLYTQNISGQSSATLIGSTALAYVATNAANLASLPTNSYIYGANTNSTPIAVCAMVVASGTGTLCSNATINLTSFNFVGLYAGWSLYLTDVTGVYQGMTVTGLSNVSGTVYVEYVNPSTNEVRLSKAVGGQAGTSLTFAWPQISTITNGMQVQVPGTTGTLTVSSVNTSTGVVTLSGAITAQVNPATSAADSPYVLRGSPVTFWAPYTNAQAAALQMDALGIQAAEQAAEAAGGGLVQIPAGTYLIDQFIEFPVFQLYASTSPVVSLQGAGEFQTILQATKDLGRDNYILTCGDPTGQPENGNGVYGGSGAGAYCNGHWRDLQVTTSGYSASTMGVRPTLSSVPISMGGLRAGPRREMDNVYVNGFNTGIEFQGDHTRFNFVTSRYNFIGFRLGPAMTTLYGDDNLDHTFFLANTWAGYSIANGTYWNGIMVKPYAGFNPYAFYCEPGSNTAWQCMAGSVILEANWEATGCGTIIDGQAQPSIAAYNATAYIADTKFESLFTSGGSANQVLAGGCTWRAYFNLNGMWGVTFDNVDANYYANVSGGQTESNYNPSQAIFMLHRASNYIDNAGGITVSGNGLRTILINYGTSCQEFATGGGGYGSDFWYTGADRQIQLIAPGDWTAKPIDLDDSGATTVAVGEVFESVYQNPRLNAARSGTASLGTAYVQGVSLQAYSCNMNNKFIVVGTSGRELPVLVPAAETPGTLLQVGTATIGTAATLTSFLSPTGEPLGVVVDPNGGSTTQVFMQSTFSGPP